MTAATLAALSVLAGVAFGQRLELGQQIKGELAPGETRAYSVVLRTDQYMEVGIRPHGIATGVRLRSRIAKENLLELHLPESSRRPVPLCWISKAASEYQIELTNESATGGDVEIRLDTVRPPRSGDTNHLAEQSLFEEARTLGAKRAYPDEIAKLNQALAISRRGKDRDREAAALSSIGEAYFSLYEYQTATSYHEQALAIQRELKDRLGEGASWSDLGRVNESLSHHEQALECFDKALEVWREVTDRRSEAETLDGIGGTYTNLSQFRNALSSLEKALAIQVEVKDRKGEGKTRSDMGYVHESLSHHDEAFKLFSQALEIQREVKDRKGEGATLDNLGFACYDLSRYDKAVQHFEQALKIREEVHDRHGEADTLNNLGAVWDRRGQKKKAIGYYERALAAKHEIHDRQSEGATLDNIGVAYKDLGEFEKAITYFARSLPIEREVKDREGEGLTLNNFAFAYENLGQYKQSLAYLEQSLAILREVKDRQGEAAALTNQGKAYGGMGQFEKALESFKQALEIQREVKESVKEALILTNIGLTYSRLGQYQRALGYFEQALRIERRIKARRDEGVTLHGMGFAYHRLGQSEKALEYINQALAIHREVENPDGEAEALASLMNAWKDSGKPRLAIFHGKQAVNTLQSLRSGIRGLNRELQHSFLEMNQKPYHTLAELLISQGRLPEAEQVLNLLKEDEYRDFVRGGSPETFALDRRADLTGEEAEWEKQYRQLGEKLVAAGAQHGELLAKRNLTAEEMQKLTQLEKDLADGSQAFNKFLDDLGAHFSSQPEANARVSQLRETDAFMADLRELPAGTVAIYTVAGVDRFLAILVTPDIQKAYEYPITAADLNRKVLEFRQIVRNPRLDPRPLAQELYKILVAPLAEDLNQAKASTLMWSLDGDLRYVPLAALFDGKQYLVEQYRISVFTPASLARLKDHPDRAWKAAGFGLTKAYEGAPALPEVRSELDSIIAEKPGTKGVLPGEIRIDDEFTEPEMRKALLQRYPVVHIASHYRFQPGNASESFLLMGDGSHLSLAELDRVKNQFAGVQLLTLSACNTGVGDTAGNGAEVEGLGVLAQRQGAKAVVASLWAVADMSTSLLMSEFYRFRETTPDATKLDGLREAQLALLRGKAIANPSIQSATADRALIHEDAKTGTPATAPAFPFDPKAPYAHPYYWAPFFLIGNCL